MDSSLRTLPLGVGQDAQIKCALGMVDNDVRLQDVMDNGVWAAVMSSKRRYTVRGVSSRNAPVPLSLERGKLRRHEAASASAAINPSISSSTVSLSPSVSQSSIVLVAAWLSRNHFIA
jgi:hypothetical protein